MKYEKFEEWSPQPDTIETLEQAKAVILEYADEGYDLTLRQLYYQLVAKDLIPNQEREYNRLTRIVSRGRRAGMLPWDVIEDRERSLRRMLNYDGPADFILSEISRYSIDLWEGQTYRPEVWVEKKALESVVRTVCNPLDVPFFACKGYVSDTAAWNAAKRHQGYISSGQLPVVLHLGDHDPSGMDMSRDIEDRLKTYGAGGHARVKRIALNMNQIEEHNPPPNPAKVSDSRYEEYAQEHGTSSWELDALDPPTIHEIVEGAIKGLLDENLFEKRKQKKERHEKKLRRLAMDLASDSNDNG